MAGKSAPAYVPGWWGRQWLALLADCDVTPDSEALRRSAWRAATQIRVMKGRVEAVVEAGSRDVPVTLRVKPLSDRDWKRLLDTLATDRAAAQRLLSGNPGPELGEHAERLGLALFPRPKTLVPVRCACNNPWNCRHMNALAQQGAALFDANPYLWLEVLGRPRPELFAQVRPRLADQGSDGAGDAPPLTAAGYWQTAVDPERIPVRPGVAAAPAALLQALGPLPLPDELTQVQVLSEHHLKTPTGDYVLPGTAERPLAAVLEQYLSHLAAGATALALGERAPVHPAAKLPGKALGLGERLAPELEAAVRQAGGVLSLWRLRSLCPTAAALPESAWRPALNAALPHLPGDLTGLAGAYVTERSTVLTGAVFRHVITFDEGRQGELSADADWVRALAAAGFSPPYKLQPGAGPAPAGLSLFQHLRPAVGDELTLRVVDPAEPRLAVTLRRRGERPLPAADQAAAALVQGFLSENGRPYLTEAEAVAVLLAEGRYREEPGPLPVWLLPLHLDGLFWPGTPRAISLQWNQWQPAFARPHYGYWPGRGAELRWFATRRMNAGEGQRQVEAALAAVERWCTFAPDPQDVPASVPGLGTLLGYLWLAAPPADRGVVDLPAVLADWFTLLGERHRALQPQYAAHIAACGLTDAYARRRQTLPPARETAALLAWRLEGYRWIGEALCASPGGRAVPQ